jgi:predicted MFS family arabinose efflux permease
MPAVREVRPGALELLGERRFRLYGAARTVNRLGNALAPVALAFAVLETLGTARDLGLVLAAYSVPQVLFVLVGGVWADRLPRNRVLVVSMLVAGAAQTALCALLLAERAELWQFAALAAVNGTAFAFTFPAQQGLLPEIVSRDRLQEANALLRVSLNVAGIGGAALGGLLVHLVGPAWAIGVDAATFLAAAGLLALLRLEPRPLGGRDFLDELREGWTEFVSRSWVWSLVVAFSVLNGVFFAAFFVLGPLVADRELGGAAAWGLVLAAQAAGLVAGGTAMLRVRPRRPLVAAMLAVLVVPLPLLLLALGAPLALVVGAAFATGVAMEVFTVLWDSALQQHVPGHALSRVASYDALGSFLLLPAGYAVVGPLAAAIGVDATLWVATLVVLLCASAPLLVREVRELPRVDRAPALAQAPRPG